MPNPYFTWSMAEELAVGHMRAIGFPDAKRTPQGTDGGIDVTSATAVAQVKYHTAPIGISEIQRMSGVAGRSKRAIFYSSSGYTASARVWAEQNEVALFSYTTDNQVTASNRAAESLSDAGRGDSVHPLERSMKAFDDMSVFGLRGNRWASAFSNGDILDYVREHAPRVDPNGSVFGRTLNRQKRENVENDTIAVGELLDELSEEMQDDDFDALEGLRRLIEAENKCRATWKFNDMDLDAVLPPESAFEWRDASWRLKG